LKLGWNQLCVLLALIVATGAGIGAALDVQYAWITSVFDAVAHLFYEVPTVAALRRPSQLVLVRWHLGILATSTALGLLASIWLSRHWRAWVTIFIVGYAIRAIIWICGGNLPLVPGDSCHYLEVAKSVLRGEGPVTHYIHSFFRDYPRIRMGESVLNDWDTPFDAYVRASAFRIAGLRGDSSVEARIGVAKACSFALNLLAFPTIYIYARRRYSSRVAIWVMAVLAVLPIHAIYAGFILRENLVVLLTVLAVWMLTEIWQTTRIEARPWAFAFGAGLFGGLAVLTRMTALVMLAASGIFAISASSRRRLGPLLVWVATIALVCLPWARATYFEYGTPFFSMTSYFEYNFSWTVHHFDKGNTLASQFYTLANLPEIARVKLKSLLIIPIYSTMIVGLPLALGFCRRLRSRNNPGSEADRLGATIYAVFILATLKSVADVTQVAQLGRYYLPVFALMLPGGVAGVIDWIDSLRLPQSALPWLAATFCALVWADPSWSYDASWFTKNYQLHWPALREAGEWVKTHPHQVPPEARIMTWFPWEMRVTSDRITILMPRNYDPRRIREVIAQYGVTHFLWGSFEPPPFFEINPEAWAKELEKLRFSLGLTDAKELYQSSRGSFFPVRLYRLQ
jgi:4-amino-4-deoxy-L-arabinose transferase-like glycosyltransferase